VTPLVDSAGATTHYLGVVIARYLDVAGEVPPSVHLTNEPFNTLAPHEADPVCRESGTNGLASMERDEGSNIQRGEVSVSDPLGLCQPGLALAHQSNLMMASIDALDATREDGGMAGRVPPFLTKLCEILTVESSDIVTFTPATASFMINNPASFAKEVLPRYFKHNKLGSFSQQLHTYGFRRKANASSLDATVEFFHGQYSGLPGDFMAWIRAGGAVSKRAVTSCDPVASAPPQLINDMRELDEGTRQHAQMFQQAKAIHAVQLRSVISKLTARQLLSADSASYISSLMPATPMLTPEHLQQVTAGVAPAVRGLGMSAFCGEAISSVNAGAVNAGAVNAGAVNAGSSAGGFFALQEQTLAQLGGGGSGFGRMSMGSQSMEGLQAQWDALDAGIAPLNGRPLSVAASDSGESMQPFFDTQTFKRHQNHPASMDTSFARTCY